MPTLLFSEYPLGPLRLPNRVVMAPLTRNRAPGAIPNALMATYYAQRADPRTGAGLIVTEGTAISAQGQGYQDVPGLYAPEQLAGWRTVTQAVHARGGHIFCQLWHVGRISHTVLQPGHLMPVAPSALCAQVHTFVAVRGAPAAFVPTSMPRALTATEIQMIVRDYARAARAAVRDAGFDGVEIHAANGYLIEQFLKRSANQREDRYGGDVAARTRFALEVARAVCDAVGGERVGIRISPASTVNDVHDEEAPALFEHLLRGLAALPLAYVHIIEGSLGKRLDAPEFRFDHGALKKAWRAAGGRGAWIVNHGYDAARAEAALASGDADLVSFGKPFISMPDLTERMRRGLPFVRGDRATFYGGGAAGYTDYPTLTG